MPTTTNRGYEVPAHGSEVDTWDVPLNGNFQLMDVNLGATVSVAVSSSNITLTQSQYKYGNIFFTGTLSANIVVTFPAVSGWWSVYNGAAGNFYIQITCGGGTRVCAPPGEAVDIMTDGVNVVYRNLGRVGTYVDYATSAVPNWITNCSVPPYLLCDGSTFSAVTYPFLNQILGSTTLPDFRGRYGAYLDGGTNRITTSGGGVDGATLKATGGQQNRTISQAQLPSYNLNTASLTVSGTATSVDSYVYNINVGTRNVQNGTQSVVDNVSPSMQPVQSNITGSIGGTLPSGGSGTALQALPPTVMSGIRLIRAA